MFGNLLHNLLGKCTSCGTGKYESGVKSVAAPSGLKLTQGKFCSTCGHNKADKEAKKKRNEEENRDWDERRRSGSWSGSY